YFLDQVANRIIAFSDGSEELVSFADLAQWEDWAAKNARASQQAQAAKTSAVKPDSTQQAGSVQSPAKKKKLSFKDQRELDSMESTIQTAETHLAKLTSESELPENASNSVVLARLSREMAEAQAEVERLYARWAELEA